MPTKILAIETPTFQLGSNIENNAERISPEAFSARIQKHRNENLTNRSSMKPIIVIAPEEVRLKILSAEAGNGPTPISLMFFANPEDAANFLPYLPIFADEDRAQGAKDCLASGATIYTESFFNSRSMGTRLDPCFAFARSRLAPNTAINVLGSLQALVFLGIQHLPDQGEKGTGEKVDVQIGSDEKILSFTVRFELPANRLSSLRISPLLNLPRVYSEAFETRYLETAGKIEINCLFFRNKANNHIVEITSFHHEVALEKASTVKSYSFKTFASLTDNSAKSTQEASSIGFRKKFSEKVRLIPTVESSQSSNTQAQERIPPPVAEITTEEKTAVANQENIPPARNGEIHIQATEDAVDPLSKRDVITNIKESQNEGLKQSVKLLQREVEESKKREKELMKMVDKAVQSREEAIKKNKEIELKLKQASAGGGSKMQILEKQLEEQKRQNKELSKRVSELAEKLKAA